MTLATSTTARSPNPQPSLHHTATPLTYLARTLTIAPTAMCKRKLSHSPEPKTEVESALPLRQASHSDLEQWDFLSTSSSSSATHTAPIIPGDSAAPGFGHEALPAVQELSQSNVKLWDDLSTPAASSSSPEHTVPTASLEQDLSDSSSVSASASVQSDMGAHPFDDNNKLKAFNIWVRSTATLPRELQEHVDYVIQTPRSAPSPAAKNLWLDQEAAELAEEATGIDVLVDNLLFAGEAKGGERHIFRLTNAYLDRAYLPSSSSIPSNALQQAICDTAICYIKSESIRAGGSPPPLTAEEEVTVSASFVSLQVPCRELTYSFCRFSTTPSPTEATSPF